MYEKSIRYDRETRDYAMYLDNELVGFAPTYHEAEIALDQLVFELMSGQMAEVVTVPKVAPADDWEFAAAEDAQADEDARDDLPLEDDDYSDAMAESAQGTYNGKVPADFTPSTCVFCCQPHHPQSCSDMQALLFAPFRCACGALARWKVPFVDEPRYEFFCNACYTETYYIGDPISAPLDVDFAPAAWEA